MIRKKRLLVYRLSTGDLCSAPKLLPGFRCSEASQQSIGTLFENDPVRRKVFLEFLNKGYYGVILHQGAEWVSYGWMSTPATVGPPHLPLCVKERHAWWLFYGHTKMKFRGLGLHKLTMWLRIRYSTDHGSDCVYTDTTAANIPSRRGILSLGFQADGIVDTYTFRIPRVKSWVWGSWDPDAKHPPMDGGTGL